METADQYAWAEVNRSPSHMAEERFHLAQAYLLAQILVTLERLEILLDDLNKK